MQLTFGAGDFFAVPLSDAQGNAITNPTPIQIGAMQEMSLDFSGELKELFGAKQFAIAVARGKVKRPASSRARRSTAQRSTRCSSARA